MITTVQLAKNRTIEIPTDNGMLDPKAIQTARASFPTGDCAVLYVPCVVRHVVHARYEAHSPVYLQGLLDRTALTAQSAYHPLPAA